MRIIVTLFATCFLWVSSAQAEIVTLPSGTAIVVSTVDTISSEFASPGDDIQMIVTADVKIDGKTVIKAGSGVLSTIAHVDGAGAIGEGGQLSISVTGVYAVDGALVPVLGTKAAAGEDETTGTVVVGVVLCPLALLNEGDEAVLAANTQFRVIAVSDVDIDVP